MLRDQGLYARAIGYATSAIAERPATPPPVDPGTARP